MDKIETVKALILQHSDDERMNDGMVYQVWQDGEITLQKGGSLLWQRNLHMIEFGNSDKAVPVDLFPHRCGDNAFIYTDRTGADALRAAILERNS